MIQWHRYGELNVVLNINHFPNMVNQIWVTLHIADTYLFKGECLKDKSFFIGIAFFIGLMKYSNLLR